MRRASGIEERMPGCLAGLLWQVPFGCRFVPTCAHGSCSQHLLRARDLCRSTHAPHLANAHARSNSMSWSDFVLFEHGAAIHPSCSLGSLPTESLHASPAHVSDSKSSLWWC